MENRKAGILAVVSGLFFQIIVGVIPSWGNNIMYATSYLRLYDDTISFEQTCIVQFLTFIALDFGNVAGTWIINYMHPKTMTLISTILISGGVLVSSFVTNLYLWLFFVGVCFGIGAGLSFFVAVTVAWSYLPQYKGRVSGIILCVCSASTSFFNTLCTWIVNPEN
jgi:MFS family permease